MARLKSIWAPDLRASDRVSFETLGGNVVEGVVQEVDATDPCMVTIAISDNKGGVRRNTFLRVSNAAVTGDPKHDRIMAKPVPLPPVKFTKEEILDKFLEEGGENGSSNKAKAGKARKKGAPRGSGSQSDGRKT